MNTVEPRSFVCWLSQSRTRRAQILALIGAIILTSIALHRLQRKAVAESAPSKQSSIQVARMSEEITIHAAGRGNPWINLSDGHELITPYSGPAELTSVLERNEARPLSLCSADFDEDGVPDLISGYAGPNGGIVTLLRGNVDSIYPNAPEAQKRRAEGTFTDAPFLSPAFVFAVPEAAEFIGAGDFDGDGHWDVVTAARGSDELNLMSGDGKGGLRRTKRIYLPGGVTAMVVGEINRRDGLDDVVVGVSGEQGARVLVFEGPEGALRAAPEVFELPAETTSLALGQLDDNCEMDLAIATGHELIVVCGRDRKLSLGSESQAGVKPAIIDSRFFEFAVRSIAFGDFIGNHATDLALLCDDGNLSLLRGRVSRKTIQAPFPGIAAWKCELLARDLGADAMLPACTRISSLPVDSLLVLHSKSDRVNLVTRSADGNQAEMTGVGGNLDDRVASTVDAIDGPSAVLPMRLNSDALSDLVVMREGTGVPGVITTAAAQTFTVTTAADNGDNNTPTPGSLRQAIINANNNPGADTIVFNIPGSAVPSITPPSVLPTLTQAATLDGTTQQPAGRVELNGTNAGQGITGLSVGGGNSTIRGLVINRFTDNGIGVGINGGNVIEGNFIGTNSSGTAASGNAGFGIFIVGVPGNIIGSTAPSGRNIISASGLDGITIVFASAMGNAIQGNFIGTDITGTADIGNKRLGVFIADAVNTTIGGTTASARNVISGNDSFGVQMQGGSSELTVVQGNFIGTDMTGTIPLGNAGGIFIISERTHTVGGTTPPARNIISGNKGVGITIEASVVGNLVQGNYIGTSVDGSSALSNLGDGILVTLAAANVIGGTAAGTSNVISGNANGIGLGFLTPSGKTGGGDCTIQGNLIGTDAAGTNAIGNRSFGVFVNVDSVGHRVLNNLIAFNDGGGVRIPDETSQQGVPGFRITVGSNGIFSNGSLAIDLGPPGVTPNELINPLPGKANERQNFPVLSAATINLPAARSAQAVPFTVTISGSFHSIPSSTFAIEFYFCTSPCSGSGAQFVGCVPTFLGTRSVTTDAMGDAMFVFPFDLPNGTTGGYVNASATNPRGSTSEFSQCFQISAPKPVITGACKGDGKQLIVNGAGFVEGAKVFLNGEQEKTSFVSSTQVIAKKAGKRAQTGDTLKVRNADGSETAMLTYTRNNCSP